MSDGGTGAARRGTAAEGEGPVVLVDAADGVATLTLNRPTKLNALNRRTAAELLTALDGLRGARAIVITGSERAFSAGADLVEGRDPAATGPTWTDAYDAIAGLPQPTFAAIEGYCLGGGLELALCCDFRVAGDTARLGTPEVHRGILPGGGGTQRLPRLIGPSRAKELMFFGEHLDAATAGAWGLVNRVVPAGAALGEAQRLAAQLAKGAPLALREIKGLVDGCAALPLPEALVRERARARWLRGTADAREGIEAFRERRAPNFRGEE